MPEPQRDNGTPASSEKELDELRHLLIGKDLDRLREIEERVDPSREAERVGRVLPEAVEAQDDDGGRLTRALTPSVETVITVSVRKNPQVMADALFPVMGPAIRKSIMDTLSKLVQSLNEALEYGLSPRGLRWRFEAWRTKRPFGEVVLLHTLLFRVEQVFLIHRDTGLPLQHVARDETEVRDTQMVSGMLTAIRDFVRDSFADDEDDGALRSMMVGDLTVWVEAGPHAVLAAVIRGKPPESLRTELQEALETVHLQRGADLAAYQGQDERMFESVRPALDGCLVQAGQERGKRGVPWKAVAALVVALGLFGWWLVAGWDEDARFQRYIEQLEGEAGILVTASGEEDGRRWIRGLRDPLAPDPASLAPEEFRDAEFRFGAYASLEQSIVEARVRAALDAPGVDLRVDEGVVHASGAVTPAWIERARATALGQPGVTGWNGAGLEVTDPEAAWRPVVAALDRLEGVTVEGTGVRDGRRWIRVARDPLAVEIAAALAPLGIDANAVEIEERARRSDDRGIVELRARRRLAPPDGVTLTVKDGVLVAAGAAPSAWVARFRRDAPLVPGVISIRANGLTDTGAADRARFAALVTRLDAEPGVVVTRTDFDARLITGLRDRLARSPDDILVENGYTVGTVRLVFRPYYSTESDIVRRRARRALVPPDTVRLSMSPGGVLTATGVASHAWIEAARRRAPNVLGVDGYVDEALQDSDRLAFDDAVSAVRGTVLLFARNEQDLATGEHATRRALVASVERILAGASILGLTVRFEVDGHADRFGDPELHDRLSRRRAEAAGEILVEAGVPASRVTVQGLGSREAKATREDDAAARAADRKATFRVVVE